MAWIISLYKLQKMYWIDYIQVKIESDLVQANLCSSFLTTHPAALISWKIFLAIHFCPDNLDFKPLKTLKYIHCNIEIHQQENKNNTGK
jgi:hypothetical protein